MQSFKTALMSLAPMTGIGIAVEAGIRLERSNASLFNNSATMVESATALGLILLALILVAIPVAANFRHRAS